MRFGSSASRSFILAFFLALPALGCAATTTSFVDSDTTLGRVVVYRNGIAYFERTAEVDGSELELSVPQDKVDDFLKSLTVVDVATGKPAPIGYPTDPKPDADGTVKMKIQLREPGTVGSPKKLLLTYVTEAPSWKPSYRVVLGDGGKVELQGWAIVDNTSGEDWRQVKLGVGSSSALSFRFDLHSVRLVHRETLASDDLFAVAPPTGTTVLSDGRQAVVLDTIDDGTLRDAELAELGKERPATGTTASGPPRKVLISGKSPPASKPRDSAGEAYGLGNAGLSAGYPDNYKGAQGGQVANFRIADLARRVQNQKQQIVVEGFAAKDDEDKNVAALGRANRLREQLIMNGVDASQVVAVANTEVATKVGGARVVQATQEDQKKGAEGQGSDAVAAAPPATDLEPIGTSHFESQASMSVPRGTSAMVSILSSKTDGEVVYLYDRETPRGDATYPFRSVRLTNPTDSTLETGPVTVFGQGRFIGEGLTEPIPGRSTSFVPFALDRQIVVERKEEGDEGIARIITVQRGVLSTEMRHTQRHMLTINNRLASPAVVYVRHTVPKGYKLSKAPEARERLGEAHLFRVEVPATGKIDVLIEEETPVFKTVDIRSTEGMSAVRAFLSKAAVDGPLGGQLKTLLELQKEIGNIEQRIETQREQMQEYRTRMNEIHEQIFTLKAVKTAGPLMRNLEKKLEEMSDRLTKSTVDLVGYEEKRMIARVKLQDGIAELTLDKPGEGSRLAAKPGEDK